MRKIITPSLEIFAVLVKIKKKEREREREKIKWQSFGQTVKQESSSSGSDMNASSPKKG